MAEPATPGITITRVFDAPRERVWREWTEPERFADWYGGVEAEVPLASVSMEVRPGGAWRAVCIRRPYGYGVCPSRTVPRQSPLAWPRSSMSCLNRSRSWRTWRWNRPSMSAARSVAVSGSTSMSSVTCA